MRIKCLDGFSFTDVLTLAVALEIVVLYYFGWCRI